MSQQSKIESEANKLLRKFAINNPPIDLEEIAEFLKVKVTREPLDPDVSGVMLFENGKKSVAINSNQHINRQRFTLAHEIGHLILHATSNEDRIHIDRRFFRNSSSSSGEIKEEIEANAFAACLLMPKKFLKRTVEKEGLLTDFDIYKLALRYKVSEQAMTLRLVKLKYIEPD